MPKARPEDIRAVLEVMYRAPELTTHTSFIARNAHLPNAIVAAVIADLKQSGYVIDTGLRGGAGNPRKYQLTPAGSELAHFALRDQQDMIDALTTSPTTGSGL